MSSHAGASLDNNTFRSRLKTPSYVDRPADPKRIQAMEYQRIFGGMMPSSGEVLPDPGGTAAIAPQETVENDVDNPQIEEILAIQQPAAAAEAAIQPAQAYNVAAPAQAEYFSPEPIGEPPLTMGERLDDLIISVKSELKSMSRAIKGLHPKRKISLQSALLGIAMLVFVLGVIVSFQTYKANNAALSQIQEFSQTN